MAMEEKGSNGGKGEEEEEQRTLLGVLDFDLLCSTVAMQTQGKWGSASVVVTWKEDEVWVQGRLVGFSGCGKVSSWIDRSPFNRLDVGQFQGKSIYFVMEWFCLFCNCSCPCYRFGKNMKRAGFGSSFVQGIFHLVLVLCALANAVAFSVTRRHYFLYLAVSFTLSVGAYLGFFRMQMRQKFNIKGSDSYLDDCLYHLICPCCTLSQEARTLEMNNVQDGTWHGRGDTICLASYSDGSKASVELNLSPPHVCPMKLKGDVGG